MILFEKTFSESELPQITKELMECLSPRDRIFIEGPLGVGKSTFAKSLLEALGVKTRFQGSPTFSIAHEYQGILDGKEIETIHIDFYRLENLEELEAAGIPSYFEEREALTITEWISKFPDFKTSISKGNLENQSNWDVTLSFSSTEKRSIQVFKKN